VVTCDGLIVHQIRILRIPDPPQVVFRLF